MPKIEEKIVHFVDTTSTIFVLVSVLRTIFSAIFLAALTISFTVHVCLPSQLFQKIKKSHIRAVLSQSRGNEKHLATKIYNFLQKFQELDV